MIHADRLRALEAVVAAASGARWRPGPREAESVVAVEFPDGHVEERRITRESAPAAVADVEFIAHCRHDLGRLVACLRGQLILGDEELGSIERRASAASPRPWRVFLEADGGIGGCNVISVSEREEEPDLYIWHGTDLAPDPDFELVGVARNEIPELLEQVRSGQTGGEDA